MKKKKQILAWIGIILLIGLYLLTLILAVIGSEATQGLLMACIACTIVIPCLIYGMIVIARLLENRNQTDSDPNASDPDAKISSK